MAGAGTHSWADSEALAREKHAWFSLAYAISNIEPPGFGNGRAIKRNCFLFTARSVSMPVGTNSPAAMGSSITLQPQARKHQDLNKTDTTATLGISVKPIDQYPCIPSKHLLSHRQLFLLHEEVFCFCYHLCHNRSFNPSHQLLPQTRELALSHTIPPVTAPFSNTKPDRTSSEKEKMQLEYRVRLLTCCARRWLQLIPDVS